MQIYHKCGIYASPKKQRLGDAQSRFFVSDHTFKHASQPPDVNLKSKQVIFLFCQPGYDAFGFREGIAWANDFAGNVG